MDISTITEAFGDVALQQPSTGVIIATILAAVLLLMSAFASGSEIAFFSLSPSDVAELEDGKFDADKKKGRALQRGLESLMSNGGTLVFVAVDAHPSLI